MPCSGANRDTLSPREQARDTRVSAAQREALVVEQAERDRHSFDHLDGLLRHAAGDVRKRPLRQTVRRRDPQDVGTIPEPDEDEPALAVRPGGAMRLSVAVHTAIAGRRRACLHGPTDDRFTTRTANPTRYALIERQSDLHLLVRGLVRAGHGGGQPPAVGVPGIQHGHPGTRPGVHEDVLDGAASLATALMASARSPTHPKRHAGPERKHRTPHLVDDPSGHLRARLPPATATDAQIHVPDSRTEDPAPVHGRSMAGREGDLPPAVVQTGQAKPPGGIEG
jgi:hypothetical protein